MHRTPSTPDAVPAPGQTAIPDAAPAPGQTPTPDAARVAEILGRLEHPDAGVRLAAAQELAADRDAATAALDRLVVVLDDPDSEVRMAAINAIAAADPVAAEPAIAWALQSPDYPVAVAARNLVQGTARLRGPDSTVWRDPSISRGE